MIQQASSIEPILAVDKSTENNTEVNYAPNKPKYDVSYLMNMFNEYRNYKEKVVRGWRLIRSLYSGNFWDVFKKHIKDYSLTPDWNYFEYAVQAYQNSIYSGSYIGTITPCRADDEVSVDKLNAFINYKWNKWGMKNKFLHVGKNGELYNLGAVRVDWNEITKDVVLKTLSPDEVYLDPSVIDYREGSAIFIERSVNLTLLSTNENLKKIIEEFKKTHTVLTDKTIQHRITRNTTASTSYTGSNQVSLIECFIRNEEGKLDQIFILNEDTIIEERLDLNIQEFPIVIYTPSQPDSDPYGVPLLSKITNTAIVLNILDSIEATQPYRLLNRVKFVNVDGRINMRAFSEYGNTPGASFECKGDPSGLVHYVDIPTIPDLSNIKSRLENSIFQITGVDSYYKGRMTNSLQTTGATQAMQARVTMLTDNSRITMLEEFCERITKLIIEFYSNYSGNKHYKIPKLSATGTNKVVDIKELSFRDDIVIKGVQFDYMINASILLPMNQANLFESAKALYEMQGQYQFKTQVITEEDLIRYSDFPQKDLILQRINKDKLGETSQDIVATLTNFASIFSKLLAQGLSEEQASMEAINMLVEEKNAQMQDPSIGQGFR